MLLVRLLDSSRLLVVSLRRVKTWLFDCAGGWHASPPHCSGVSCILFHFISPHGYRAWAIISVAMCHKSAPLVLTSVNSSLPFSTPWDVFSKLMPLSSPCYWTIFLSSWSQKLFLRITVSHFFLCFCHWLESHIISRTWHPSGWPLSCPLCLLYHNDALLITKSCGFSFSPSVFHLSSCHPHHHHSSSRSLSLGPWTVDPSFCLSFL